MPKRNRSPREHAFVATLLALLLSIAMAGGPAVASPGQTAGQGGSGAGQLEKSSAGQLEKQRQKATVEVRHLPEPKSQKHTPKPARSAEHKQAASSGGTPATVVSRSDGQVASLAPTTITTNVLTGGGAGGSIELEQLDGALNTGPTPPDNGLGVGPNHIVQMVNGGGFVYDRTTTHTQVDDFSLSDFFGAPIDPTKISQPAYSDPRVLYDDISGRWFAAILIFDGCGGANSCANQGNSEIDLAVSATSNPLGDWAVYPIDTDYNNRLLDQPKLGVSNDKAVMTWNITGFAGPYQFVEVDKADLVALAGSVDVFLFAEEGSHYNVMPVVTLGNISTEFAASINRGDDTLSVFEFTGTPTSSPAYTIHDFLVGTVNDPPDADQKTDSRDLDTGTAGEQSAVWQGNILWAAGNTACTPPGDSTQRSCLSFHKVNTASWSLLENAVVGQNGAHLFYPAVMVDNVGNLFAGHSVSSTNQFGSAGITYFAGGTIASSNPGLDYEVGVGPYNCTFCFDQNNNPTRNRWGDYSGAAQDPNNPKDVWLSAEFGTYNTSSTNNWAVEIGRFTAAAPVVSSISPNHGPELSTACAPTVTVNGTDFQLGASVKFGSVPSGSVSVLAPEQLTAVAPAQAAGTVDVTVTTPIGTSATSLASKYTYDPDTVAPTTQATPTTPPNANGWNKADFTVNLDATDQTCGSGIKDITVSATGAITYGPVTTSGASASLFIGTEGITTINYYATDNAGNVESTKTLVVRLDKTPPAITITSPTDGGIYLVNQPLTAAFSCSDGLSGLASCVGTQPNGSSLDTSSVGTRTFTVNATDLADNAASKTSTYYVTYNICLLYNATQPITQSQVAIKLSVCDFNGVNLSSASIVLTAVSVTPVQPIVSNANPDFLFRFNTTVAPGGGYVFNLIVKDYPAGSYTLDFTATGDPITHHAPIVVK
jgi:IPT/TIG domain